MIKLFVIPLLTVAIATPVVNAQTHHKRGSRIEPKSQSSINSNSDKNAKYLTVDKVEVFFDVSALDSHSYATLGIEPKVTLVKSKEDYGFAKIGSADIRTSVIKGSVVDTSAQIEKGSLTVFETNMNNVFIEAFRFHYDKQMLSEILEREIGINILTFGAKKIEIQVVKNVLKVFFGASVGLGVGLTKYNEEVIKTYNILDGDSDPGYLYGKYSVGSGIELFGRVTVEGFLNGKFYHLEDITRDKYGGEVSSYFSTSHQDKGLKANVQISKKVSVGGYYSFNQFEHYSNERPYHSVNPYRVPSKLPEVHTTQTEKAKQGGVFLEVKF